MKKKLFKLEVAGFVFVGIIGTLSHFLFEILGGNAIVGLFCAVNESVWEHLKMLFFPYLLWSITEYFLLSRPYNFFNAKIKGVFSGLLITTAFYYTYSGITGTSSLFMDILSFILGIFAAFSVSYMLLKNNKKKSSFIENISILLFAATAVIFFIFTFSPPIIPLFEDPKSLTYGL